MVHLGLLTEDFQPLPLAFWADGTHLKVLVDGGEFHPEVQPSVEYHLTGGIATAFDAFVQINRTTVERLEDVERGLAELEKDPLNAPPLRVLELKRQVGSIREELGRAITGLTDMEEGRVVPLPEGAMSALRTVEQEMIRIRDMIQATQSALTDIFMIRQTEQANQLQLVSNRMAAVSNRVAELSNISNIRMLGLSYVTLILAVVATVILFPNTAATILGMPSAAGVPTVVVYMVLVGTAVAPMAWFLSQGWIRDLFRGMSRYEARVNEGMGDLPERIPEVHSISPDGAAASDARALGAPKERARASPPQGP
jgi:hypothetical protein